MNHHQRKPIKRIFRSILFNINFVLSGCAVGFFLWKVTDYVKSRLLDHYRLDLNAWTSIYYHPQDASLFNYLVLCIGMALYGLVFYVRTQRNNVLYVRKKLRTLSNRYPLLLLISSVLFFVLLIGPWEWSYRLLMYLFLLFILFVPLKHDTFIRLYGSVKESLFFQGSVVYHNAAVVLFAFALLAFLLPRLANVVIPNITPIASTSFSAISYDGMFQNKSMSTPIRFKSLAPSSRGIERRLELTFIFKVDKVTGYENLFQTSNVNSGLRAELNTNLELGMVSSKAGRVNGFSIGQIESGRWYRFKLKASSAGGKVLVWLQPGKGEIPKDAKPKAQGLADEFDLSTDNIMAGTGYSAMRPFSGQMQDFELTARDYLFIPNWYANISMGFLAVATAFLLLVIILKLLPRPLPFMKSSPCRDRFVRHNGKVLLVLVFVLLCAISVEPLKVIKGPVYVMNEYKNIYSDTKIHDTYVNNKTFLDAAVSNKSLVDEFIDANGIEYFHQNASWGPFNHIGHILNPLNEYLSGKTPADVYMHYGQGNTLLYKWTMDLFGGMSLDNFYKCYAFYIIYSLVYVLLLLYLFYDKLLLLNAFALYSIAFFSAGYSVFIHAPGVIPTIHLFDTTVFLFLLLYFRRNNLAYLLSAIVLAVFSMYMNRQFGLVLLISLGAACVPYLWETKQGKERYSLLAMLVLLPLVMLVALFFKTTTNVSSTLYYFLMGYLSWRPDPRIVFLTIVYLVVSYHFLFSIRKQTHDLKYAFIFVFIYSQGLLAYFYWNGRNNHLVPVIPFIGLELLLMLYISKELIIKAERSRRLLNTGVMLATGLIAVTCIYSIAEFYKSKRIHTRNYEQHRIYHWDFDRAKIATTINPEPFRQSIALIQKYSPQENSGIHILSVYDNVLPFLAKRYSLMPFFEMQWFVFTSKERTEAIDRLKSQRPEYLFVENGIDQEHPDPWAPYFNTQDLNDYRKSNQERKLELGKIFTAVEESYEKTEEGVLLSVYKKKSLYVTPAGMR